MEDLENRDDPQNTKGANAQTDDNDRANRITGAAQDRGQDLDQRPGNQTARHLNEGGEINDALLQEIRKSLTTLDISIDDFNRAVEKEYGKSG